MPPRTTPRPLICRRLELPDAEILLWPQALAPAEADALFTALRARIDWQQEEILVFGRRQRVPRLVAWHGDPGASYVYSGTAHAPVPWGPELLALRRTVENLTGHPYDSVLLNLYRDGRDGMGWHADDEPELGVDPVIASVTLGTVRRFRLRHRRRRDDGAALADTTLELGHGSVLLMAGPTQHHYLHCVPKTARPVGERINLTFRRVVAGGAR
jgi:alkylated DNA repair dioxygenase AlkB